LPPEITFEETDDFNDGIADRFPNAVTGEWAVVNGRFVAYPANGYGQSLSLIETGTGGGLDIDSVLEFDTTVNTQGDAGIVYDYYGTDDYKFVAIDVVGARLVMGHYRIGSGLVIDSETAVDVQAGVDYKLALTLKGTTVSISVDDMDEQNPGYLAIAGYVYNGITLDGAFGLISTNGESSFDDLTFRSDDAGLVPLEAPEALMAAEAASPFDPGGSITAEQLDPIVQAAIARLDNALDLTDESVALLGDVSFEVADLYGLTLGLATGNTVRIDDDAAGHGWFIDDTPVDDKEFGGNGNGKNDMIIGPSTLAYGDMDLLSVVTHELGHVLGLDHGDGFMDADLDAGERVLADSQSEAEGYIFDEGSGKFVRYDRRSLLARMDEERVDHKDITDDFLFDDDDDDWLIE